MVPDPVEELRNKMEATRRKREVADFCRAESECDKALHRLKVLQRRSRRRTKRTSQVRTFDGRRSVPSSGGGQTDQVLVTSPCGCYHFFFAVPSSANFQAAGCIPKACCNIVGFLSEGARVAQCMCGSLCEFTSDV